MFEFMRVSIKFFSISAFNSLSYYIRLFHTLKYLKPIQVAYRLWYRFSKPRINGCSSLVLRNSLNFWASPRYVSDATQDGKVFEFLGQTVTLFEDWNCPDLPKLWLYNLHYQDDLNAIGSDTRAGLCNGLIDQWIAHNPPITGIGWEPYCISLRAVNWIKWFHRGLVEEVPANWVQSLYDQVSVLEQRLEYHILANHLFANAKALVFAGVYFSGTEGDRWLKKGLKILEEQLAEQFLSDGGHYELSPMYHSILLWDVADLINLGKRTDIPSFNESLPALHKVFVKGMEWLDLMVHPDNDISFFNDSTFGISPNISSLKEYAKYLNLPLPYIEQIQDVQAHHLSDTGYCIVDWSNQLRCILDVGFVGPDYQPGHAHADTLSFELSLFGQRLFVNSGVSQYGSGSAREFQRSTRAHCTVEVDGENSSEVWGGFRVARRARVHDIYIKRRDQFACISASHDGYHRLYGKVKVDRKWLFSEGMVQIVDQLSGCWTSAVSRFYCHPLVAVAQVTENEIILKLPQGQEVLLSISGASSVRVVDSHWYPAFGVVKPSRCIELVPSYDSLESTIRFSTKH